MSFRHYVIDSTLKLSHSIELRWQPLRFDDNNYNDLKITKSVCGKWSPQSPFLVCIPRVYIGISCRSPDIQYSPLSFNPQYVIIDSFSDAAGAFVSFHVRILQFGILSAGANHIRPVPPNTYGSHVRQLRAPAVPMGAPFLFITPARSSLFVVYFVFTCPVFVFFVLMYLTSFSHAGPLS
jgi:hypothetical protein